ncbi:PaaI family thioesterase [Altererythrobacter lutimaris]|uniref:PaaI family thioesterase n=1 Tax=Altererythrobacter lutimaris TaxID=2743979 RepID=A0A850HFV4_9SPHN|nr:PaaI family thioesterase [Altererythrobacter lutimaris]NVE93422.1 PaaI family thioesterase [Altererythrobacter lutimaris]
MEWQDQIASSTDGSPHSELLGSEFVGFDAQTATATMRFKVHRQMTTWRGGVQGGLVAGYLDDVMGYAYVAATDGEQAPLNLEISMQLLGLLPEGATIIGKGRVVRGGRRVIFLEGELLTEEGQVLARSTSTAIPTMRPVPPPEPME